MTMGDVETAFSTLRMTVNNFGVLSRTHLSLLALSYLFLRIQITLHAAVKNILVAGTEPRDRVLEYISETIVKNEKRAAMQIDPKLVSSDGFMLNLVSLCLKLCEPFTTLEGAARAEKVKVIEADYPLKTSRYHLSKETRLKGQSDEFDAWKKVNFSEEAKKGAISLAHSLLQDVFPQFCFFDAFSQPTPQSLLPSASS